MSRNDMNQLLAFAAAQLQKASADVRTHSTKELADRTSSLLKQTKEASRVLSESTKSKS